VHVHQDDVRPELERAFDSFEAVVRAADDLYFRLGREEQLEHLAVNAVVVDDENADGSVGTGKHGGIPFL